MLCFRATEMGREKAVEEAVPEDAEGMLHKNIGDPSTLNAVRAEKADDEAISIILSSPACQAGPPPNGHPSTYMAQVVPQYTAAVSSRRLYISQNSLSAVSPRNIATSPELRSPKSSNVPVLSPYCCFTSSPGGPVVDLLPSWEFYYLSLSLSLWLSLSLGFFVQTDPLGPQVGSSVDAPGDTTIVRTCVYVDRG